MPSQALLSLLDPTQPQDPAVPIPDFANVSTDPLLRTLDTTPPTVSLLGSPLTHVLYGHPFHDPGVLVHDDYDGLIAVDHTLGLSELASQQHG